MPEVYCLYRISCIYDFHPSKPNPFALERSSLSTSAQAFDGFFVSVLLYFRNRSEAQNRPMGKQRVVTTKLCSA